MPRSVIVEVSGVDEPLPAGRQFAGYRFDLRVKGFTDAVPLQSLTVMAQACRFDGLNDATYTVTVTPLGGPAPLTPLADSVFGDVVVGGPAVVQTYVRPTGLSFLVV
jgi:hypothetical protein